MIGLAPPEPAPARALPAPQTEIPACPLCPDEVLDLVQPDTEAPHLIFGSCTGARACGS